MVMSQKIIITKTHALIIALMMCHQHVDNLVDFLLKNWALELCVLAMGIW